MILGGMAVAGAINLLSLARLGYRDGALVGTLTLRGHLLNLALFGVAAVLLAIIVLYLLAENLQIFAG